MIKLHELLEMERACRKKNQWFIYDGEVENDRSEVRKVSIKCFGFYNQILRVDGSCNICAGHTINKVGQLHSFIRDAINNRGKNNATEGNTTALRG